MRSKIKYLIKIDLIGLIYCLCRSQKITIIPFSNSWLRFGKKSRLAGDGKLLLGLQWDSGRYMPSQVVLREYSTIRVEGLFRIYSGHSIWINKNAEFILGSGFISNNFSMSCFKKIKIGHNVNISENVTIRDNDGHTLNKQNQTIPIMIGNNVWIGLNSTILKGVSIGDGSVVAAGSVVTRDVPPKTLVAGVPAVVKKRNIHWE